MFDVLKNQEFPHGGDVLEIFLNVLCLSLCLLGVTYSNMIQFSLIRTQFTRLSIDNIIICPIRSGTATGMISDNCDSYSASCIIVQYLKILLTTWCTVCHNFLQVISHDTHYFQSK